MVLGVTSACCLVVVSPAAADQLSSVDAARAAGDASGFAPAGPGPDAKWTYKGKSIDPLYASENGLVCNETDADITRCFDTDRQADIALLGTKAVAARAQGKHGKKAKASCSASDGSVLKLYQHSSYSGWQLNLASRSAWYDMNYGGYNDDASSWNMGGHSGHISEHTYAQGLGWYFPGPTSVCDAGTNMSGYAYQGGGGDWNDRASSRYRN
jgi:hypothetical protein